MKRNLWLLMIVFVLGLPNVVQADVGTPLMWAGFLHLMIGNAVIGVIEGLLIAWVFRLRKGICIPTMIGANYFSAWVGGMPIVMFAETLLHPDINNAWQWVLALVATTYLATLLMEWPFVAACFWKRPAWLSKSLRANLLAQTASYLGLVGWYALASQATLYTDIHVVPPSQLKVPLGAVVYYIAAADGDVYRQELPTGPAEKVYPLKSSSRDDALFVRKSKVDPDRWDLFARRDRTGSEPGKDVLIQTSFASIAVRPWGLGEDEPRFVDHRQDGAVCHLGDATGSHWDFEAYFSEGLTGTPKSRGRRVQLIMETLLSQWRPCNATQLPNDQVVFQLGDDQICILNPELRQVALIAHGQGPVVVLKDSPGGEPGHY